MLQSPHLVYRSELGPEGARGVVSLTSERHMSVGIDELVVEAMNE